MKRIFILLPSPHPTGPIKGAVALANSLVLFSPISMVFLKTGPGIESAIDAKIDCISLADFTSKAKKLKAYRRLLNASGGRNKTISLSSCLSADFFNLMCRRDAIIISSVRGNLPQNYKYEFGWKGQYIACGHLMLLRWFDQVVAMNNSMAAQITRYTGRRPYTIGNFIDEKELDCYRAIPKRQEGPIRFIFVGSLTKRKQAQLLLKAAVEIKRRGYPFQVDVVGDGSLKSKLEQFAYKMGLNDVVSFHGFVAKPFYQIANADCMVIPSMSEGVSRAVLESLYLGVPCLLRDTDGNHELVKNGFNGVLFKDNSELVERMLEIANWSRNEIKNRINLLPHAYRQDYASKKFLSLLKFTKTS